ncbi:hypothetical protein [Pontibacter pudoricolor]|uniref:hypothetical protein n=1 Tax=Pontibacter pudoricolor TaxID=2694930 RepID=UPI001390758E|nr:hypothetical protein [Pontibacter pudoricolor]
MKKGLLTLCLMGIGVPGFCQDIPKGGLNFTIFNGTSEILRTQLEGAGSFDGDGFYGVGISYLKPLNRWLDIEAGVNYSKHTIMFTSHLHQDGGKTFSRSNLQTVSFPVTFRANFLKYLFVNFGAVADFETNHSMLDNQSGIGALAGIGFKYGFTPKVSAFVNPFLQQHAIIPFRPENHQQRMLDAGVKLGVGLKL